jgi:hypothetical protein
VRVPAAVVYHIHHEDPPRKLLPEAEKKSRSGSISVERRRRRDGIGGISISVFTRATMAQSLSHW